MDTMDGDSTESFVELSGNDETEEEKEHPEGQSEQSPASDGQEPEEPHYITCDSETEQDDPACGEETPSSEPPETAENTVHENKTPETNTGDGPDRSPEGDENVQQTQTETLGPEEDAGQHIPAEDEMETEGYEETQNVHDGSGSPEETTCEGSKDTEEPNESSFLSQTEPHNMQGDQRGSMEPNPHDGSDQESAYREERDPVDAEDSTGSPQDGKEAERGQETQNHDVMYDKSAEEDSTENKGATQEGDQEPPGRSRGDMSEEPSMEQSGRTGEDMSEEPSLEQPGRSRGNMSEEQSMEQPGRTRENMSEEPSMKQPGRTGEDMSEEPSLEQPGRSREDMSEEQSMEQPRLETEGGDRSESLWTSRLDGEISLRIGESGAAALCPVTVPQLFSEAVKKYRQKVALCVRAADGWQEMAYSEYGLQCRAVARGFLKLGLERFNSVLILGSNSPEWFMAEIGTILAGGLTVCMDPESTESFCLKVALDVRAQIVLVDDHKRLKKIQQIQGKLPTLKAMVQWSGPVMDPGPGIYTWNELLNLGSGVEESYLDVVMANQRPHECCAVIYSPEGAGEPRGAMMSHDNVTWTSRAMQEMLDLGSEVVVVSHLPLSHISVQMFDLWLPLSCGGTTYFVESDAQKGSLVSMLCDVRPTIFLGFPGLWKKVQKRWMLVEKKATQLQKMTIQWAKRKGRLFYTSSGSLPWGYNLAERLVFRSARRALGLDRCPLCYVGMEPIGQDVAEYFRSLGIDLLELYGKNETTGFQSIMVPSSQRTGRVELVGWKSRVDPDGLRLWGRNIFMGYLGKEQETNEAFTEDGWWTGCQQLPEMRPKDPEDYVDPEDVYMEL